MKDNEEISKTQKWDYYKKLLRKTCEINNISLKPRFESIEDLVTISIKNHLKEGVDLDCLKIINLIYQTVSPLNIRYTENLILYPCHKRLDNIQVIFTKDDYILLNEKIKSAISKSKVE